MFRKHRTWAALVALFVSATAIGVASTTNLAQWYGTGTRHSTVELYISSIGSLIPGTTSRVSLGTTALRFKNVWADKVETSTFTATKPSTQNITSTTTIQVTGTYINLASTGALTMTAAPNIATGTVTAGTIIYVLSQAQTVTLRDFSLQTDSGVSLSTTTGTTIDVSSRSARGFLFNGAVWKQIN